LSGRTLPVLNMEIYTDER